jgi:DNA polymerase I-like protein with 3'-5' exonuclease and polymerase domains
MNLITIDFETFYSKEFSLSKMTTEEYIRSDDFEVIGVAIKVNNGATEWASGTHEQIKKWLHTFDWADSMALAHNTMFDGAILSWLFDVHPRVWADTLCMGRAIHGVEVGGSLKALTERYGLGPKGTEVLNALGKRRADFSGEELSRYGDYCVNDVELTYKLFKTMVKNFPKQEMKLIDVTLRMFIDPIMELDLPLLEAHLQAVKDRKDMLLEDAGVSKDDLMSNPKFAELLKELGVEPPMKISPTTGKETLALAKSDEDFKALADHEDDRVQSLVAARLGTKSTLEETRTQRFIDIAKRGPLPVPVRYYAAHTGRWGGDDKINMQNLPSRGPNAKKLKQSIIAPKGFKVIDADSAQIEARVLAWLAGQDDLVEAFTQGKDVYKKMASAIYGVTQYEVTKEQRFVGKTTILGCIAEGTPVLSDSGWKPIEQVSTSDKLWDGEEWVCHQGLVPKGMKETWSLCGSWLTPDHKILCGTEWKETQSVVQDENTLYQALETGQEKLPSQVSYVVDGVELRPSLLNVIAGMQSTQSTDITLRTSKPHGVLSVQGKRGEKSGIGNTLAQCLTMPIELDSLTGYLRQLLVAITPSQNTTYITGNGALAFTSHGEKTEQFSLTTSRHWMDGITQSSRWIESTTTKAMNPTIFGSLQGVITCGTNVKSQTSKRLLQTYDLAYAGPRNRFTILTEAGPVIAHNCGYGMGAIKFQAQLKTFGFDMGLDEARRVIDIYRRTNNEITGLWKQAQFMLENLARGDATYFGRAGVLEVVPSESAIRLPSGLLMRYDDLSAEAGERGYEYSYKTRRGRTRIYGGKVIENVCQAVARCIIGEQMLKIAKKYRVVLTVHDAITCCVREADVDEARAYIEECMRWVPDWAYGLPVNCESGVGNSYGDCE